MTETKNVSAEIQINDKAKEMDTSISSNANDSVYKVERDEEVNENDSGNENLDDNGEEIDNSSSANDSPDQNEIDKEINANESDSSNENSGSNEFQGELDSGYRIISEIVKQNKTTCWPFMEAVDAEGLGLWDYHLKIKEPMWLNKIIDNFETKRYSRFTEFARDFRIMVENCYRYNTTEHPISKKAKRLEMTFEAKLALLKKDTRDSATVAKTSNGRFATLPTESNALMRSGRISVPSTSGAREADSEAQSRLVYDFVRCEEAALAEDERQSSYREHKQQQSLYQQVAAAFVVSLESHEEAKEIKTCHMLPEIGLFLHLTETTLRLPPLAMYNLEMSLLLPSDSIYLAKIMTSFLCTYYERSLITQRPPMLFKTWDNRLRQRIDKWFELVLKYNSYYYASDKFLIGMDFFHAMNWKNPLYTEDGKMRSFLDLTYHQKAMIIKALCDNLTTFQSVQNNISSLACDQSRAMTLGHDVNGNEYTYFPQFCGDDVRIYRHRQYGDLQELETPDPLLVLKPQKDLILVSLNENTSIPDATDTIASDQQSSPLKNNVKNENDDVSVSDDVVTESFEIKEELCESDQNDENIKTEEIASEPAALTPDHEPTCGDKTPEKNDTDHEATENKHDNSEILEKNADTVASETDLDVSVDTDVLSPDDGDDLSTATVTDNEKPTFTSSANFLHTKYRKRTSSSISPRNESTLPSAPKTDDPEYCYDNADAQWTPKKKNKKRIDNVTISPIRRSSRKRAAVNYTSLLVPNDPDNPATETRDQDSPVPVKKRQKHRPRPRNRKKTAKIVKVQEPDEEYGSLDFELICDNIESLRDLICIQEDEHENAVKSKKSKTIISNVSSLVERLQWLLGELSSFESHFEKARFDAKIQLKREHDELLRAATTGRAIQSNSPDVDPWEDELISKNTVLQSDGTSTYTPPASIYYEDSEEESDKELRRSKRRPKRYESDEDFVLDSGDEATHQTPLFLYDEYDEDRQRLLSAALDELENRLQKQANALMKMMGCGRITRQNDFGEASPLLSNERRTRQRSKKENKVFRKVLILALKEKEEYGPSLLPLLRTDQSEIGEIVERVLAQEEVARQQKRLEREEEQKKKKAMKQAMFQKNKAAQASRRAAKKLVDKYKVDRHEVKIDEEKAKATTTTPSVTSMWSPPKKQTIPTIATGVNRPNRIVTTGKAENVMVRLQNGKIGRALRFPDGRVVPIMRMDDAKAITGLNPSAATAVSEEQKKVQTFHPHISLSAHRSSVIRHSQYPKKQESTLPLTGTIQPAAVGSVTSAPISTRVIKTVSPALEPGGSKPSVAAVSTNVPSTGVVQQPAKQTYPVFKSSMPATVSVAQRLTLPSGQVINLVVKQQSPAVTSVEEKSQNRSLGRMFVDHITDTLEGPTMPSVSAAPSNPPPALQSSPNVAAPNSIVLSTSVKPHARVISQPSNNHANFTVPTTTSKLFTKPLGIVSPMQVKQPCASDASMRNQQVEKAQLATANSNAYMSVSRQQQTAYIPSVFSPASRYHDMSGVVNAQESSSMPVSSPQRLQLGMQNVALVTQPLYQQSSTQQVQIVPALMAGSVPLVQPVQFVQTVPIQVNAPMMFVAQGQPHLQIGGGGNDTTHHTFPTASPNKSIPPPVATTHSM